MSNQMIRFKRFLAKKLYRYASLLITNDKEFHRTIKHSINYEAMCVSVISTGDHLRGDMQPCGNFMVEMFLDVSKRGFRYRNIETQECELNGVYFDEWKGKMMSDEEPIDKLGNIIEVGDVVIVANSGNCLKEYKVSAIVDTYIVLNSRGYETKRFVGSVINKTKADEIFKKVHPERYI